MYTLEVRDPADLHSEAAALASFVASRWLGAVPWNELASDILDNATHDFRFAFDASVVRVALMERLATRRSVLGKLFAGDDAKVQAAHGCDRIAALLLASYLDIDYYRDAALSLEGKWDFERQSKECLEKISGRFPAIFGVRPKGYNEYKARHTGTNDAREGATRGDLAQFKGARTGDGALSFPSRVSLANVFYDDVDQGRRPYLTLVGAIYGHGLRLAEHNNTVEFLRDMEKWNARISQPVLFLEPNNFAPCVEFNSPLMIALTQGGLLSRTSDEDFHSRTARIRQQQSETAAFSAEVKKQKREILAKRLVGEILADERTGVQAMRDKQALEEATARLTSARSAIAERPVQISQAKPQDRMR